MGREGLCAGRCAVALRPGPWRVRGRDDVRAPDRGAGRCASPARRDDEVVADRPDGDGRLPGHRPAAAGGRRGGEALRRHRRGVSRRTGRSARASWRRRSTTSRSRGGARRRCPRRRRRRPIWTAGASRCPTAAGAGTSTVGELAAAEPLLALPRAGVPGRASGRACRRRRCAGRV